VRSLPVRGYGPLLPQRDLEQQRMAPEQQQQQQQQHNSYNQQEDDANEPSEDTEEETADEDSERDYDEEDEDPECKAQARRAGGKKSARFFAPGTRSLTALKWAFPAFVNGSCLFASMWLLHIATFYYVKLMDREELAYVVNSNYTAGQASYALSPGLRPNDLSYGSLQDPLEATLGFK
ncbi:unnamed protein product, partial [Polarella glacialis]